jgi:hypothetical protein
MVCTKDIHDYFDIYLGPITALATFFLGYFLAKISFNLKQRKRQDSLIGFYTNYLNQQLKATKKFAKEIEKMISNMQASLKLQNEPLTIISQPFILFDSIDKISLRKALESKSNKTKIEFAESVLKIEYYKSNFEFFKKNHHEFLKANEIIGNKWNNQITKFHDLKSELLRLPKSEIIDNPHLIFLNQTYNKWIGKEPVSILNTKQYLLLPLNKYFSDIHNTNPDNQIAIKVMESVQQLLIRINELQYLRENYIELLNHELSNLKKVIQFLTNLLSTKC